jgi:VanZ family protein
MRRSFRWLHALVRRFRPWFVVLWVAGLIGLAPLCLLPQTAPPTALFGIELLLDKVFHFIAYGGLAGLAVLLFGDDRRRFAALAVVLIAALGYEIGQLWVPNRSFGWDDLAANAFGFTLGTTVGNWVRSLPQPAPVPHAA